MATASVLSNGECSYQSLMTGGNAECLESPAGPDTLQRDTAESERQENLCSAPDRRDDGSVDDGSVAASASGEGMEENCPPLTAWTLFVVLSIVLGLFSLLLLSYLSLPASETSELKLPRSIDDLKDLREHMATYARDHTAHVSLCFCALYITLQTFALPGTPILGLLAGSLFGLVRGVLLVVSVATLGSSSSYFLASLIGRPIATRLWPQQMKTFRLQVAKRRDMLWNYMLFLRVTPAFPNAFVNIASPLAGVPYTVFVPATFLGLLPGVFVQVRTGLTLRDLKSFQDLGDMKSTVALLFIGVVSLLPLMSKKSKQA